MGQRKTTQKMHRQTEPCQTTIYDERFRNEYSDVAQLIACARELLLSSLDTEDENVLLAKTTQGSRSLLLSMDRDNFEFILRMPGGRQHILGGNLAMEMKGISIKELKSMMEHYLTSGKPISIPGKRAAKNPYHGMTQIHDDADPLI